MFCPNCGNKIRDDAKFCENCGASISNKSEAVINENLEQNTVANTSKKKIIVIAIISFLVLLIIGVAAYFIHEEIQIKRGADEILSFMENDSNSKSDNEDVITSIQTTVNPKITTSKINESEKTATTIDEPQKESEKSEKYMTYLSILKESDAEIKSEYGDTGTQYQRYYLYDINHDGIYELLVHINDVIIIYSVDENNELMEIGNINGGNTLLTEKDGKLYSDFGYVGYHLVEEIQMVGWHGVWSVTQETVLEQDGLSDYTIYGTQIKGYDISDTSAVEALCPEELLADSNHITELETPVLKTDCYLSVENESCVEVTWDEIPGADSYYISYMIKYNDDASTISSFEGVQSDNVWRVYGAYPIYVYNFSVKAYAESNGNEIYSQWSNSVAVSNSDYVSGD